MKSNIKKILGIVLSIGVFMYIFSGIVFADSAPLDFGSFQDMNSTGGNNTAVVSQNNTITNNNVETNKTNTVVSQDSTTLPKTGSNNEVIFIIGITILVGTTVFIYNKTKIK
jgi:LPXTG-motif cell wall-anchored protein